MLNSQTKPKEKLIIKNPFKPLPSTDPNLETQPTNEDSLLSPRSIPSQDSSQLISPISKSSLSPKKSSPRRCPFKILDRTLDNFSHFWTFEGTPAKYNFSPHSPPAAEYLTELDACKAEINKLKHTIQGIQQASVDSPKKNFCFISQKELQFRLQQQKQELEKQYKIALSRQKKEIFEKFQEQFEKLHEKIISRVRTKQVQFVKNKGKEIEELFAYELLIIENEFEEKLQRRVSEVTERHESVLDCLKGENLYLKKENLRFKEIIEEYKKSLKEFGRRGEFCVNLECEERFKGLSEQHNALKAEVDKLKGVCEKFKRMEKMRLCGKCLAFTQVDNNLTRQLENLKSYLELED